MSTPEALTLTGLVFLIVSAVLSGVSSETKSYRLSDRLNPLAWIAFGLAVVFFLSAIWSGVA